MSSVLPTFLGIGAVRGGSTSMYRYLRSHPDIFMSDPKELDFFIAEANWKLGVRWYERHFAGAEGYSAAGEVSPGYTAYPHFSGVPERIASILPNARFLYFIRDPIDRMYSQYQNWTLAGRENRPAEIALLENPTYLDYSRYALQIDQYLAFFPPERLLVVSDQEMARDLRAALRKVYGFLGADPEWWSDELLDRANVTERKRVLRGPGKRVMQLPGIRTARKLLPAPAKDAIRRVTHRGVERRSDLPAQVRRELEDRLREDVSRLRSFVGDDFDGWGIA